MSWTQSQKKKLLKLKGTNKHTFFLREFNWNIREN